MVESVARHGGEPPFPASVILAVEGTPHPSHGPLASSGLRPTDSEPCEGLVFVVQFQDTGELRVKKKHPIVLVTEALQKLNQAVESGHFEFATTRHPEADHQTPSRIADRASLPPPGQIEGESVR